MENFRPQMTLAAAQFPCIRVKEGDALTVRRCDGYEANKNWPLFSVKILKDMTTAATAAKVEFLSPTILCKTEHLAEIVVCGLALPCVLQELDAFGSGDFERFDEDIVQDAVSCQQRSFKLRIIKQRAKGFAFFC
ncbi:hypothetical protein Tcan_16905 [Toxocara canis]|uniref:Uncharacterized protein n=1 Tax=Toxocara canis TaxID=6265 RepID=A0A0B2VV20_TOXCA|nr:hypothetical protein Tcan_16905 [Toxocara canis]